MIRRPAALFAALLAACMPGRAAEPQPTRLVIGVADTLCQKCACSCVGDNARRHYDGTAAAVKADAGVSLEFKYYEENSLLREDVLAGKLDGVIAKTWTGLTLAREAGRDFERLADVRMPAGEAEGLTGVFIVPAASPVKSLADLRGRRIIYGPVGDHEKSHAARATLQAAGVPADPARDTVVPSCKTAVIRLMENKGDAAVISSYAMRYGCISVVAEPSDFREIGRTAPAVPFISVFADKRVPEATRVKLKGALLKLTGERTPADLFSAGYTTPAPWAPKELETMPGKTAAAKP